MRKDENLRDLDKKINLLRSELGDNNAKEDLRRFAHHLRNYEYSGGFKSIKSKLLVKAEIIKSIYELCHNSENQEDIKDLLSNTLELNIRLYNKETSHLKASNLLARAISDLNIDNKFSIIVIKSNEKYFSLIIEKLFEGISKSSLKSICNLIADIVKSDLSKKEIFLKLNSSLKYIENCPLKIHCLDKNEDRSNLSKLIDLDRSSNIRIYNYFNGNLALGYSKIYETPKEIANHFSVNIIYSISYILAKKSLHIDDSGKKIVDVKDKTGLERIFQDNVKAITEYTISRLAQKDKFVIGALDRKFTLNSKVKQSPFEIKQININELDEDSLVNLKNLLKKKISIVRRLKKLTEDLSSNDFDYFIDKNDRSIPQLILDQAKLKRAKSFYNKAKTYEENRSSKIPAIELYSEAVKLDPKFKEAFYQRGMCHYNSENFKQAVSDFTRAIELDEYFGEAFYYRGLSHAKMKDLEQSIIDFKDAIKHKKSA